MAGTPGAGGERNQSGMLNDLLVLRMQRAVGDPVFIVRPSAPKG